MLVSPGFTHSSVVGWQLEQLSKMASLAHVATDIRSLCLGGPHVCSNSGRLGLSYIVEELPAAGEGKLQGTKKFHALLDHVC